MPASSKSAQKSFLVQLPEQLAVDLAAFLRAHYDASRARVVRDALQRFIQQEVQADPVFRSRFLEERGALTPHRRGEMRLIDKDAKRS